jgi:hypothetical protein
MAARTAIRTLLLAWVLVLAPASCGGTSASQPAPARPAPNPYQAHVKARSYAIHLGPASAGAGRA